MGATRAVRRGKARASVLRTDFRETEKPEVEGVMLEREERAIDQTIHKKCDDYIEVRVYINEIQRIELKSHNGMD